MKHDLIAKPQLSPPKHLPKHLPKYLPKQFITGVGFALLTWFLSRLVVIAAMVVIAPLLPELPEGVPPKLSWWTFSQWDSFWYYRIAESGYDYVDDGGEYSVAFFPLFPLLVRGLMTLGLPFAVAGTLLNSAGFLGTFVLVYQWLSERYGERVARWTVLTLAWCPISFFGTVIYTEGLFLLFSTAALAAFDRKQHIQAGIWGALASATRFQGVMLVPAFLLAAWKEQRSRTAYLGGLLAGLGIALFSLYCTLRFGEPLAFIKVQQAWRSSLGGFDWQGWLKIISGGTMSVIVAEGWLLKGLQLAWLCLVWTGGAWLWRSRHHLSPVALASSTLLVLLSLWLQWGYEMVTTALTIGGLYLLWHHRHQLTTSIIVYGIGVMGIIAASGSIMSVERIAYGTISTSIVYGVFLSRYPTIGFAAITYSAIALVSYSIRFAQGL